MDFKQATDRLMAEGFTADDLARALGLATQTVRAMRLDPSTASHRTPPADWPEKLAKLAAERGGGLQEFAKQLRRTGG